MGRTSDADERLMAAALDLMWEESYSAVTIDDICKRADVRKGSFYYYFDSKAALAVAALEKMWTAEWKPAFDARFSPAVEPLARIAAHLETPYAMQSEMKRAHGKVLGCPLCSVGTEVSTHEDAVSAKVRDIFRRKRRYLESAIREAAADGAIEPCDAVQKAQMLTALVEGSVAQARIMNDAEPLRRLPAMGLEVLRVRPAQPARVAAH